MNIHITGYRDAYRPSTLGVDVLAGGRVFGRYTDSELSAAVVDNGHGATLHSVRLETRGRHPIDAFLDLFDVLDLIAPSTGKFRRIGHSYLLIRHIVVEFVQSNLQGRIGPQPTLQYLTILLGVSHLHGDQDHESSP